MRPELVKIENEPGFLKDKTSQAIISTDNSALEAYRARRKREQDKLDEINNLKQDVAEIKDLLKQLLGSKG
jgi:HAMP domain-containing protein